MPAQSLYGDNPFRILGLRTTAGDREIAARLEAGASQAGRDLDLIGPAEERFRRARDAVRDPSARLRAELFWIAGDNPVAPPTLDLADDVLLGRALTALQTAADDPRGEPQGRAVAAHDLAVVAHAAAIRHRWLGPDMVAAVERWSGVFGDASYWRYLVERARALGVTMDPIPALREHLAETLAAAWIDAAADLLDEGQDDAALALIVAIRLSSLPRFAVDGAVRDITLPLRAAVKSGANAVCALADLVDGLAESTPPGWIARHLTAATDHLRNEVGAPLARLRRIAPGADDPATADKVAQASARLASAAIGRLGDWNGGLALVGEAVVLARSGEVRGEMATLQSQIRHVYHRTRATEAQGRGELAAALAHLELALAATTSIGAADELRRTITDLERSTGEQERLAARTLTREIESRMPERLEAPAAPARPAKMRRRVARAEPTPVTEGTSTDDPETAPTRPPVGLTSKQRNLLTDGGPTDETKTNASLLNRAQSGSRYVPPEERRPGRAARVVSWLSAPSHAAQVVLPLAAVFLLAVALNSFLPWRGDVPSLESVPASSSGDEDRDDARPAPTKPPSSDSSDTSQAGGVLEEDEESSCDDGAASGLDQQIEDQEEVIAGLNRQIAVITGQFPNGGYTGAAATDLKELQRDLSEASQELTELRADQRRLLLIDPAALCRIMDASSLVWRRPARRDRRR